MVAVASLQRSSLDASVPRLVPREQLTAASALLSLSQNASFLLGSTLGGVLAVAPGPWLVYGITVALVAALLPGFIRSGTARGQAPEHAPEQEGARRRRVPPGTGPMGSYGRPVPTQGNGLNAEMDR
jgi:MFS family permease